MRRRRGTLGSRKGAAKRLLRVLKKEEGLATNYRNIWALRQKHLGRKGHDQGETCGGGGCLGERGQSASKKIQSLPMELPREGGEGENTKHGKKRREISYTKGEYLKPPRYGSSKGGGKRKGESRKSSWGGKRALRK